MKNGPLKKQSMSVKNNELTEIVEHELWKRSLALVRYHLVSINENVKHFCTFSDEFILRLPIPTDSFIESGCVHLLSHQFTEIIDLLKSSWYFTWYIDEIVCRPIIRTRGHVKLWWQHNRHLEQHRVPERYNCRRILAPHQNARNRSPPSRHHVEIFCNRWCKMESKADRRFWPARRVRQFGVEARPKLSSTPEDMDYPHGVPISRLCSRCEAVDDPRDIWL